MFFSLSTSEEKRTRDKLCIAVKKKLVPFSAPLTRGENTRTERCNITSVKVAVRCLDATRRKERKNLLEKRGRDFLKAEVTPDNSRLDIVGPFRLPLLQRGKENIWTDKEVGEWIATDRCGFYSQDGQDEDVLVVAVVRAVAAAAVADARVLHGGPGQRLHEDGARWEHRHQMTVYFCGDFQGQVLNFESFARRSRQVWNSFGRFWPRLRFRFYLFYFIFRACFLINSHEMTKTRSPSRNEIQHKRFFNMQAGVRVKTEIWNFFPLSLLSELSTIM